MRTRPSPSCLMMTSEIVLAISQAWATTRPAVIATEENGNHEVAACATCVVQQSGIDRAGPPLRRLFLKWRSEMADGAASDVCELTLTIFTHPGWICARR